MFMTKSVIFENFLENFKIKKQTSPRVRICLLLAEGEGFASLEPPAKQFAELFFRLWRTRNLWLLAPNSNPPFSFRHEKRTPFGVLYRGGGRGIRTPVGLHPNGFQDRLVMTTSIALHEFIKLFMPLH